LRSALSLALITGQPFRMHAIRAKRSRPGLLRQHLTAVLAAARIGEAEVEGAELGSQALAFRPRAIHGGDYCLNIGSAGSYTLVLQTLLPALLQADKPSRLLIEGGTHNTAAPSFDFIERVWLPQLRRMGAAVELALHRHGFAPAGGGVLEAWIQPGQLRPLFLDERGEQIRQEARVLLAGVPVQVAQRELAQVAKRLGWSEAALGYKELSEEQGPGNILLLTVDCEHLTEQFCAFGQFGVPSEVVADRAIRPLRRWLASSAAVAEHLADQLLLSMALAGGGHFTTSGMTDHLHSNIQVIEQFLPVKLDCTPLSNAALSVSCSSVRRSES